MGPHKPNSLFVGETHIYQTGIFSNPGSDVSNIHNGQFGYSLLTTHPSPI